MPTAPQADDTSKPADKPAVDEKPAGVTTRRSTFAKRTMTAFVESCVETAAGSAVAAERELRGRPRARRLLHLLHDKKNILVTTHRHPDPDALASSMAMLHLLREKLPAATVSMSIKGNVGGGINSGFTRMAELEITPWDEEKLPDYDAIILLDTQPSGAYSPLPKSIQPTAVIDHHRSHQRRDPKSVFIDIRPDVGATSSIIFSYFMELEVQIAPRLGACLLFAIESDLAGAAGTPGELDNIALSSLTLIADTHQLYQMRYVDLPQSYYVAYASALSNALYYNTALISHIDEIDSLEKPAVMADFLLRFDAVEWSLVTAVHEDKLIVSLRTSSKTMSAAEMIRRLVRKIGEGGGHRTKAGGYIPLTNGSPTEVARIRDTLRRRYLRALKIRVTRPLRLIPKLNTST